MGPFRLMYMTKRDDVSWNEGLLSHGLDIPGFTLVLDHHAQQKGHDVLPGGAARKKARQSSLQQVGSAERPCLLRQARLQAGRVGVEDVNSHVGVLDIKGEASFQVPKVWQGGKG